MVQAKLTQTFDQNLGKILLFFSFFQFRRALVTSLIIFFQFFFFECNCHLIMNISSKFRSNSNFSSRDIYQNVESWSDKFSHLFFSPGVIVTSLTPCSIEFDLANIEILILHKIWKLFMYNLSGGLVEPKTSKFGSQLMDYIRFEAQWQSIERFCKELH